MTDEDPEFGGEEEDILEPADAEENPALEAAPAVAVATVEEDEDDPSPPIQRMIDDDTIVFLDYAGEEDFIAVLEGEGSREPPAEPEKKGGLLLVAVFVVLLLLGGGGFALWWFVLRGG